MNMDSPISSKVGFSWLLRMAWRDGRASSKRLLLFMASIILGIAAVVAIQSFSNNLKDNIALLSKALMGADYIIDSRQLPNENVQVIIDSLGGEAGREVNFASMASFPKSGGTKLVRVRGIERQQHTAGDQCQHCRGKWPACPVIELDHVSYNPVSHPCRVSICVDGGSQ